jgi:hypothetical protein
MNSFNTVGHVAHFEQQQMNKGPRGGMPSNVSSFGGAAQMQSYQSN